MVLETFEVIFKDYVNREKRVVVIKGILAQFIVELKLFVMSGNF